MKTLDTLENYLRPFCADGIALAFSGGVDSTLLLAVLSNLKKETDCPVVAFYAQSVFQTKQDTLEVQKLCTTYDTELIFVQTNPLAIPEIKNNSCNRCYFCKKDIFNRLIRQAHQKNLKIIMDGTNADDLKVYRPGLKALKEMGILSPLVELGFSKETIRQTARQLNIINADKPSVPCLATRFEYHTELCAEKIKMIADGEAFLQKILPPTSNLRLRHHNHIARIETDTDNFRIVLSHINEITCYLKKLGFLYVTLDLDGFQSGRMDLNVSS